MILQDVHWCVECSNGEIIDLIPNGRHGNVTFADINQFLILYVQCKLQECYETIEAFRSGLLSVIPESSIHIFCWCWQVVKLHATISQEAISLSVNGSRTIDFQM